MTDGTEPTDVGGPQTEPLDEVVANVLDDVDAAYADYERGYTDADATLSVVMTHLDRLRDAQRGE
jgi:hypothetical protein